MRTVPKTDAAFAYENNSLFLALGKLMGGGSSINFQVVTRGNKEDYNNWERLGNPGWDYNSVLPYFKKIENFLGPTTEESAPVRGRGGPVTVELRKVTTPALQAFLRGGAELGLEEIDLNGPEQIGLGVGQFAIHDGIRESSSESYLRPVIHMSNIRVVPKATVTKINFDKEKRAVGVEYIFRGKVRRVSANKEVILSAGVINSPKILMLSGVGPAPHLRTMGIPVIADIAGVGENLQDQAFISSLPIKVNKGAGVSIAMLVNPLSFKEYLQHRTGIIAWPIGAEAFGWVKLGESPEGGPNWPDVQLSLATLSLSASGPQLTKETTGLKVEAFHDVYSSVRGSPTVTIACSLARQRSRGFVQLASADYRDDPAVDFNFMSHPDDVELMVKAIKFTRALANTTAMKAIGAELPSTTLRYCANFEFASDDYWRCFARHLTASYYHPVGTCKMAPLSDTTGVVSPRLRVRGVTHLRVVDASIMPQIVTANTMTATLMIGEKAADMIMQDWSLA